ncbi:hypothetical protein F4804DRAFT_303635 [Jackrogersella minutella]|nr:hypothetical protein F4804DRAFT_303635 [Jackrogersella minutella]
MKFQLVSLAAILATGVSVVSATPTIASRQDDFCGKQCSTNADCSGTCQWCSQPAEWQWQCVDFDPNSPTTSVV